MSSPTIEQLRNVLKGGPVPAELTYNHCLNCDWWIPCRDRAVGHCSNDRAETAGRMTVYAYDCRHHSPRSDPTAG